ERKELMQVLESELVNLPSVAARIDEEMEQARREAREKAQADIVGLKADVKALQTERTQLDRQISDRRKALEQKVDDLDTTLQERLNEVLQQPERTLAEVAIIRAGLGLASSKERHTKTREGGEQEDAELIYEVTFPWHSKEPTEISDPKQLRRSVRE